MPGSVIRHGRPCLKGAAAWPIRHFGSYRRPRECLGVARAASADPAAPPVTATVPVGDVQFKYGTYVSTKKDVAAAIKESVSEITANLDSGFAPELAILFVTQSYDQQTDGAVQLLLEQVPSLKHVYGCSVRAPCSHGARCAVRCRRPAQPPGGEGGGQLPLHIGSV